MTKRELQQVASSIVNEAVLRVDNEGDRKILKPQWRKDLKEAIFCALVDAAAK